MTSSSLPTPRSRPPRWPASTPTAGPSRSPTATSSSPSASSTPSPGSAMGLSASSPSPAGSTPPSGSGISSSTPRPRPGPTDPGTRPSARPRSPTPWPPFAARPGRQFWALPLATSTPHKSRPRSSPYWRWPRDQRRQEQKSTLGIFSNRGLAASDVTMLLVAAALFGMFFFCTLYLQQVLGSSPLETGVSYLPFSLTLIAVSAGSSRTVDRFTPKPVLVTGLLITTAGFIVLTQASGHGDYLTHVLPALVVLAIGLGMSFVPITIAATSGVAPEDSGLAAGLLNTTQQVGGSLGLAILSTISTTRVTHALNAGAALPAALTHGFKGAFIVAAILCAAGA